MAVLACDNDGQRAERIVTNTETGEQSFYCLQCYGSAQGVESVPEYATTCEVCGVDAAAIVLVTPATNTKLAMCYRDFVVQGRVAWLDTDADELDILSERAEALYAEAHPEPKPKRGRRPKLAVHEQSDTGGTVETPNEPQAVAVGGDSEPVLDAAATTEG